MSPVNVNKNGLEDGFEKDFQKRQDGKVNTIFFYHASLFPCTIETTQFLSKINLNNFF